MPGAQVKVQVEVVPARAQVGLEPQEEDGGLGEVAAHLRHPLAGDVGQAGAAVHGEADQHHVRVRVHGRPQVLVRLLARRVETG